MFEFNTAIEELKNYAERVKERAARSIIQGPKSRLRVDYAAHIHSQTMKQISLIVNVAEQFQNWRREVFQQPYQTNFRHV